MKPISRLQLSFMFITMFALGCVANAITRPVITAAQSDPANGIYRECFASTVYVNRGRSLNSGDIPDLVAVPAGWHVVGGAGGQVPTILLCR